MNISGMLQREKKKLLVTQEKIEGQIDRMRAAINAVSGNGAHANGAGKKRGRRHYKMSAAHKRAIRLGIAKAKTAKK